jgi:hypothetical protein
MSDTSSGSGRDPVEKLLESFLSRWRRGERPSPEDYAARCPERADEIRALFPALIEMERLKPAVAAATGSLDRPAASVASLVARAADEYLERLAAGESPDVAELARRYPQVAEVLPVLEVLEDLNPLGPAPTALGAFRIVREIGRGGMGVVYEAEHESLKCRVALKVMHPRFRADRDSLRRFRTEARSAAKLHHTNIVPVFDFGEQDGICY